MNETPTDLSLSASTVAENAANGTVVGTVTGTDPDSGDTKTYSFTDSAGGRFAIDSSTGQITVGDGSLLDYEAATSHSVTVRVTDAGGLTYDETFTINLTNVNETPTGADATITINEDTSHTLTTGNFGFSDVDAGDSLSAVRIDTLPSAGTLTLSGVAVTAGQVIDVTDITAGNLVFTPVADGNGTGYASFTFSVRDSNNAYDTGPNTLTFDVTAVNDAPVNAVPGAQTVAEDTPLTITGLSVADVDGNLSTVQLAVGNGTLWVSLAGGATISAGANDSGTLTLSGTEAEINAALTTLTYQGALNFTGSDILTMVSTDSAGTPLSDTDTVAITVTAVNDAPTITNLAGDSLAYAEGDGAVVIDQGADALVADVDSTNFDTGMLTVSIPTGNVPVEDVLSIRNQGMGVGQIGVSGSNVTYGGVIIGTFTGGAGGNNLVITFNGNATPSAVTALVNNITYEDINTDSPTEGGLTIRFVLTDGDGESSANYDVSAYVSAVNDAPVNSVPGAQTVAEDTPLTISGLSVNDVDGNLSTTQLTVTNGTLTVSLAGGATISAGANGSGTLTLSGTQAEINAALATLTYQGTLNFTGGDTLTMVSTDSAGTPLSDTDTVSITVTAVNDAPVITPLAPDVTFVENGAAQVIDATGTITDVDSTNFDTGVMTVSVTQNGSVDDRLVVGNFGTGPGQVGTSGSTVTYGGVVIGTFTGGSSGSDPLVITFNGNATPAAVQEVYRSIQFDNVSENPSTATRQITFDLTDGDGGTATPQTKLVYVQAANDAPVNTVPGAQTVAEDMPATITGLNVTDVDGNLSTTQLTVTNGTLTVSLAGGATISAGANGSGTLTLSGTEAQVNAALATLTYQGTLNFTGSDTLTVTSTDSNSVTDTDTVAITVTAVDDPTVVTGGTSGTGNEDTTLTGTLTATDVDGLSDGTVFTVTTNATNGTASIDPATGLWSYTPTADFYGTDSFTVTLTDDAGNSTTQVISVSVSPVVDITNDSLATNEDTAISANVLTGTNGATADSFEGTPVLTSVTQGANGTVTFLANGTVTYTPNANFNGTDSFTYSITSGGVTETATATVTVNAVNDPTNITGGTSGTGNEDTTLTGTLTATDVDGLSDGTVFTVTTNATNGTASINPATGLWSYIPNADYNGTDSFTVTLTDDAGNSTTQVISMAVTPVNDAPTVTANTGSTVAEGGTDTINSSELAVTDIEQPAVQLTYSIGTGPAYGRLELTTAPGVLATTFTQADIAAGRLIYIHNGSEPTSDNFTFTVNDGAGGALGSTTVTLTITPVNDTPTITSDGGTSTASINVLENVSAVTIVTGADVDLPAQALTYNISGGADQARFTINATTGALNFTAPPDFEVATDANGDNVYVIQVQVTDSQGASTTQMIQVMVTNVVEGVAPLPVTPTIPPVLLPQSPVPPGPGTHPSAGPSTPVDNGSVSGPVSPGPMVPPTGEPPLSVGPLPSVLPPDRPVERVLEEPRKPMLGEEKNQPLFLINDDQGRSLFSVLPVEPAPVLDPEPPKERQSVSELLLAKLDEMTVSLENSIGVSEEQHVLVTRIAALTGTTLSVGFIAWALRSGALLASFMATMPAWRHFDPLPVMGASRRERQRHQHEAERDRQAEASEFKGLNALFDRDPPINLKP